VDRPPSDTPSWIGPRGEEPSFPRRGRRGALALAGAAMVAGLFLSLLSGLFDGALAMAQLGVGVFAATLGFFALLGARRLRVCATCGGAPAISVARFPLESADRIIRGIELVDPDRIARIEPPAPGQACLRLELLHCPRCRDLGWLRATARVEGVPLRVGSTWVLLAPFLQEMLDEMKGRR
jgi:hypothetical protein